MRTYIYELHTSPDAAAAAAAAACAYCDRAAEAAAKEAIYIYT